MHFNGFMSIRMRKLHLVFQVSFRNIQRQKKVIAIFWVIGQNLGPVDMSFFFFFIVTSLWIQKISVEAPFLIRLCKRLGQNTVGMDIL